MSEDKTIITGEMREVLRSDFPPEAYSKHPTKTFLTTLKAGYVMERLNDVFGVGRWDLTHEIVSHENDYVLMSGRLVIHDYHVIVPIQYGGHKTAGKNTEIADGYKSAITDIMSKSASYLEIGIDMFKGKIAPPGDQKPSQATSNKKSGVDAVLCPPEFLKTEYIEKNWNGKLYANNTIYFNDTKYVIPTPEWVEWFKNHPKFKPQTK